MKKSEPKEPIEKIARRLLDSHLKARGLQKELGDMSLNEMCPIAANRRMKIIKALTDEVGEDIEEMRTILQRQYSVENDQ